MNNKKKLKMTLPKSFVEALDKRHNGNRNLSSEQIEEYKSRIDLFYNQYIKAVKRLDNLYDFWEKKEVEKHFRESIWYNAHMRLRKYHKQIIDAWRSLFYTLTYADGNSESFDSLYCISAEECKDDFYRKYIDKE